MKHLLLVFCLTFISANALAGFKEEKPAYEKYCRDLMKDSTKINMKNGKWALNPDYAAELQKDKTFLKKQVVCDLARHFFSEFKKAHQPKFEVALKKRLTSVDLDNISDELVSLSVDDTHERRLKAFRDGEVGLKKYYTELADKLLAQKTKKK